MIIPDIPGIPSIPDIPNTPNTPDILEIPDIYTYKALFHQSVGWWVTFCLSPPAIGEPKSWTTFQEARDLKIYMQLP